MSLAKHPNKCHKPGISPNACPLLSNLHPQVSYRYSVVKSRLTLMQARLADVNAMVSA